MTEYNLQGGVYLGGRYIPNEPRWRQIDVGQIYVFEAKEPSDNSTPPPPTRFGYLVTGISYIPGSNNAEIKARYFNQDFIETEPTKLLANNLFNSCKIVEGFPEWTKLGLPPDFPPAPKKLSKVASWPFPKGEKPDQNPEEISTTVSLF